MKRLISACVLVIGLLPLGAVGSATEQAELARLLDRFLEGASVNDAEVHDRFWAEDLIYTSSSGLRFGKAEIMGGLDAETETGLPAYSAEDVTIRLFDDTAVVTFRLLAREADALVGEYFNTGVFRKRSGQWKAVTWQATRVSEAGD